MSDEETTEARDTRRREEDFYDWVNDREQNSDYREAKQDMRDHADKNEFYIEHFSRNETKKEYEERELEDMRGAKY